MEFVKWLENQTDKTQLMIKSRLERLRIGEHWGSVNRFDGLIELKWKSGVRIYVYRSEIGTLIVLLGGNKNGQSKDIGKAKNILSKVINKI